MVAGNKGFTLLEVMIALAIMVVGLAAILMIQSNSIEATSRTQQINTVSMLARNLMIETELQIQGKSFTEVKEEETGVFPKPYEEFKWTRKVKEVEFPNLTPSSGDQANGEGGATSTAEMITKLVTNFLSKALREVRVTITWPRGKGEVSQEFTMYWVDLNHEFSLNP